MARRTQDEAMIMPVIMRAQEKAVAGDPRDPSPSLNLLHFQTGAVDIKLNQMSATQIGTVKF